MAPAGSAFTPTQLAIRLPGEDVVEVVLSLAWDKAHSDLYSFLSPL